MRTALTIAGSDPGGGAGLQADLKTFAAHGVYGTTAVTAVTVQDTVGVSGVWPVPPEIVGRQIDAVVLDLGADAVKIGMLATAAIASAVADALGRHRLGNVVLDPVMMSSSGAPLLDEAGIDILRREMLPLASVVTANVAEATRLTGVEVTDVASARRAAEALVRLGAPAAIVKGGHLPGAAVDILFDGRATLELFAERVPDRDAHGTGCTFASAIAARLALGDTLADAARAAKAYVTRALRDAPRLGHGRRPLAHFPA
jgi:hydroxymethylpyrimidine/phosphomethylpyrimidine kinase